jgi:hypothetical protein
VHVFHVVFLGTRRHFTQLIFTTSQVFTQSLFNSLPASFDMG